MLRQALFNVRAMAEDLFGPIPGTMLRELRLPWVQRQGIRSLIDVGANVGQFASLARAAFPAARIVSFEPLPDCFARLQHRFRGDRAFQAVQLALGASAEEREILRSTYSPSSSLLPMAERHRAAFPSAVESARVRVQVRKLDDALEGVVPLDGPILLKMDVQGFELEVLKGASQTLPRCTLLVIETSLQQLYVGEAMFASIQAWLAERGFALAGLAGSLRDPRDGRPLQVDAMFECGRPLTR